MGKVIDLTKLDGAHSLGKNFASFVLGDEIKEALEKLLDAVNQGKSVEDSDGYTANNLFIDGRRGSGKTTVLLTIKELLENKGKLDELTPEFKEYSFKVVDSIIDTSVNTASITFYFLSWLKKQIEKEYESDIELNEQLHRTIKIFPDYLKSCDKTCLDMSPDGDIEEKLDQSDLNFRKELFKLIDMFLEKKSCGENSFIVLFMDDLDISFPPERIQKILTEVFMFLSHPKLIIISAGNYKNLVDILTCYVRNKINKEQENCLNSDTSYKDIAKSFLEKTFAKHSVHIPSLSYEYIRSLSVKFNDKEGKTVTLNFKEFVEQILIIKLLSAHSIPLRILFNNLSVREVILIFREILSRAQKYNNIKIKENSIELELVYDKLSKIPVSELCFSDIYLKIKKVRLKLFNDTRRNTFLCSKSKSTEFEDILYRIKEFLNQGNIKNKLENGLFLDSKKQSFLSLALIINNKPKVFALFWIWFNENILFMNGFIRNFPKLLFLETVRSSIQKDLIEEIETFITFWENLNYDLRELAEYFSNYESHIGQEKNLRVTFAQEKKEEIEPILKIFGEKFIIKKANPQLSYELLFNYFSKLHMDIYDLIGKNIGKNHLTYLSIEKLLGNFREKLISRLEKETYKEESKLKYALFLAIYINLGFRVFSFINGPRFEKNIYLQKTLDDVEKLLKLLSFSTSKLEKLKNLLELWLKDTKISVDKTLRLRKKLKDQLQELEKALPEELTDLKGLVEEILAELKNLTRKKIEPQANEGSINPSKLNVSKNISKLYNKLFKTSKLYNELSPYQEPITYREITRILIKSFIDLLDSQRELKLWKEKIIEIVKKSKETNHIPKTIEELFKLPFIRSILLNEMPTDLRNYIIDQLSVDKEILNLEEEFIKSE